MKGVQPDKVGKIYTQANISHELDSYVWAILDEPLLFIEDIQISIDGHIE
jgi:hypothetical protein